jgi:hypothetical protein
MERALNAAVATRKVSGRTSMIDLQTRLSENYAVGLRRQGFTGAEALLSFGPISGLKLLAVMD